MPENLPSHSSHRDAELVLPGEADRSRLDPGDAGDQRNTDVEKGNLNCENQNRKTKSCKNISIIKNSYYLRL